MLSPDQGDRASALYRNPSFAGIIDAIASRKNNLTELQVDKLAGQSPVIGADFSTTRRIVVEFFRELESCGLGCVIIGRRGKKTRFRWADGVSMLEFARAARGNPEEAASETAPEPEAWRSAPETAAPRPGAGAMRHQLPLRKDFDAILLLPRDLSKAEAAKLGNFINALASDGGL